MNFDFTSDSRQVITVLDFIARYLFVLSNRQIVRSEKITGSFMSCVKSVFQFYRSFSNSSIIHKENTREINVYECFEIS